jgi:hypothetical protein
VVVGGLVLLLAAGGVAAFLWVTNSDPEPAPWVSVSVNDARPQGVYSREEFRTMVTGKSRAEVAAALGSRTHGVEAGPREVWHFAGLTRDPDTGRPDFDVAVVFEGETVTAVRFLTGPVIQRPGQ